MVNLGRYKPLLWIFAIPVLNIFYGLLNNGNRTVSSLLIPWDERIPFLPVFIIPYLAWYPFVMIMLVAIFIQHSTVYYRTLIALCLGLILSYITFFFFQTSIDRPEISGEGALLWLVKLVYTTDGAYNCFPSIHVLTSYLMLKGAAACTDLSIGARLAVRVIAWSVIISTVFVKQHVLLDIVGGIVVAELMFYAAGRWIKSRQKLRTVQSAAADYAEHS
ncbi:phosphatase PAP2 family protein [Paenibacillus pinihumi]|uniref:phosphatase PAP2 family protein n=1 Tax=Paenibacillus pinihumi TaxID=669462 RepID=UPI00048B8CF2|nr:phosphatase PAP2 family protein [Paenibacillus pinihumi]